LTVARISGGEVLGDRKVNSKGIERLVQFAFGKQNVTDVVVCNGQIALPLRITAIGSGKPFGYCKSLPVGFQRVVQFALAEKYVANPVVR
jgi:hypothetical protein